MEAASADGRGGGAPRTSSDSLPFGYSFEGIHDVPYEPPPAPAPGRPLLDDSDTHYMDSFFDTMGSNHFENSDLTFGGPGQTGDSTQLDFDWADELPPVFAGSTTSLPRPSTFPQHASLGEGAVLGLNHANDPSTTSPEILAAASMLYHNGQMNGPEMGSSYHSQPFYGNVHGIQNSANNHYPSLTVTNGVAAQGPSTHRKPSYHAENGITFPPSYYGTLQANPPDQGLSNKGGGGLRWGSDVSFIEQGYLAPPDQETEEEVTNNLLQNMECLEPQSSANNTRPTSPTALRQGPTKKTTKSQNSHTRRKSQSIDKTLEEDTRPRKRVKAKVKDEDDDESEDFEASSSKAKKGKANAKNRRLSSNVESPTKRRKSSQTTNSKQIRENLSEEQKRNNHILSEQKRRNLIKNGFDDLCVLVPDLQGGGFSKSAMLVQAADYLEEILRGNDELMAQLATLKSGGNTDGYG